MGDYAQSTLEITEAGLLAFADATGDHNPVHLDEEYAATTAFGRRIAHGMLLASQFSALLATELPGPGTIYLSQDVRFRRPAFIGDTITSRVEIAEIGERGRITLVTTATNQDDTVLVTGNANVMVPQEDPAP